MLCWSNEHNPTGLLSPPDTRSQQADAHSHPLYTLLLTRSCATLLVASSKSNELLPIDTQEPMCASTGAIAVQPKPSATSVAAHQLHFWCVASILQQQPPYPEPPHSLQVQAQCCCSIGCYAGLPATAASAAAVVMLLPASSHLHQQQQ
jgi:hypothetical protein